MSSEIDGLIDELALTDALMKLLNQYGILPYKDWKNFEINHEQPRSDEERDLAFSARARKLLQKQTHVFDRAHFTVSVDPMRVVTVPNTVNGKTGLICTFIGSPKDLERLAISEVLDLSKTFPHGYPEPLEGSLSKEDCNGAMKSCAKNRVWAA